MTSEVAHFEGESTPPDLEVTTMDNQNITSNEAVTFTVPATVTIAFNGYPPQSGNTMTVPTTVINIKSVVKEEDCHFDVNGHCVKCGY